MSKTQKAAVIAAAAALGIGSAMVAGRLEKPKSSDVSAPVVAPVSCFGATSVRCAVNDTCVQSLSDCVLP